LVVPFSSLYAIHEVTPIVVAIAVSMLISICSAHFQEPFFISYLLSVNPLFRESEAPEGAIA
jgi:hypothetical protein